MASTLNLYGLSFAATWHGVSDIGRIYLAVGDATALYRASMARSHFQPLGAA